ncbi:MAG: DUF4115 domain-containing protein [Gammaproteobacteria bacterium]|nr:DUF4115 domain-containing protein [Gammaproteobacteria bacterium]MBU1655667.1 DUF4115 domain-containing protein [Gammaproteobacteria bacterium]MBU1960320.1 DUF4115 domain-containing protein [Gammaproteobacteria bacterium]
MDSAEESQSSGASRGGPGGPGGRLRAARLRRNLDLIWVANQLHMKPRMVEAMEADDYDHLPSPVFVRGYLRGYARLVGEPEEDILLEYRRAGGERLPPSEVKKLAFESGDQIAASDFTMKLTTWVVVALTLGLFLAWGASQIDWSRIRVPEGMTAQIEQWMPAIPFTEEAKGLDVPSVAEETLKVEATEQRPPPVQEPRAENTEPFVPPAEGEVTKPEVAGAAVQPVSPVEAPGMKPAQPETQPAPPEAVVSEAPKPVEKPVVLELSGNSWIDIRDSGGGYKLLGDRKAGERHVLEGTPPYKVVIGNVKSVTLTVDGKPYDFTAVQKGGVARITLTP